MPQDNPQKLKKVLKPVHLWAIAVGLVISGEYFGWNYGWGVAGTIGFLIATVIVTIMYVTFAFSYTELTTSIPHAGNGGADSRFRPPGLFYICYARHCRRAGQLPAFFVSVAAYTAIGYGFL